MYIRKMLVGLLMLSVVSTAVFAQKTLEKRPYMPIIKIGCINPQSLHEIFDKRGFIWMRRFEYFRKKDKCTWTEVMSWGAGNPVMKTLHVQGVPYYNTSQVEEVVALAREQHRQGLEMQLVPLFIFVQ